ncbi:GNAT family N-acetyltransferase [Flavivirga jejuensis]|uniref:GNAT family N-acetyltransferase n=1 Tax=Flavivirga jejuensis TaxID=870487 RepID=A0ABT8WIL1_9FLAO|nr:GNAT family N-acetyltransferase [Flavivirga jejuensis]MDO5972988.1 GNAT family N-acetyltransferase [Flavivirga jejuensis]
MKNSIYQGGRHQEIIQLFAETFPFEEDKKEGSLIGKLAKDLLENTSNQYLKVFISMHEGVISACVIFSKLRFKQNHTNAWLLSPIAVKPTARGKGIGTNLIKYAHGVLRNGGVQIVTTYGDIRFYSKVGYKPISTKIIQAPLTIGCPKCWIAQSLENHEIKPITGKTYCVEAINDTRYW